MKENQVSCKHNLKKEKKEKKYKNSTLEFHNWIMEIFLVCYLQQVWWTGTLNLPKSSVFVWPFTSQDIHIPFTNVGLVKVIDVLVPH